MWAVIMAAGIGTGLGQNFPNKPVRIVTSEPGGGADFVARVIAQGISGPLGQQVIVDNRAAVVVPGDIVAKSPADGYTLLVFGGTFWLAPFLRDGVPYDPVRDFAPITLAVSSPNLIVAHPSLTVSSVKELIALSKAKPGELNYAGVTGASSHLAAELFKAMAGVDLVRIPYKGTGPALNALIGGEVQLMFPSAGAAAPHLKSGRLKALATASRMPSALAPGLPTVAATLPGYESASVIGVFAPAGTAATIIARLNREIAQFLRLAETKQRFLAAGTETVGSSPEELAATVKSEMTRLGKVIRDAGIRAE